MYDGMPSLARHPAVEEPDHHVEVGFVQIDAATIAAAEGAGQVFLDQRAVPLRDPLQLPPAQRMLPLMASAQTIPGGAFPLFLRAPLRHGMTWLFSGDAVQGEY